ncbi:alkaline phosphatase D family protein [Sphingomonas sp. CJ20]
MTGFDRRQLLLLLGSSTACLGAGAFISSALAWDVPPPYNIEENPKFSTTPFALGVASGDPAPDGFVLWTRLAPQPLDPHGGVIRKQMRVNWEVAEDERFQRVVRKGQKMAVPELAHAVHVELEGLQPDRHYWYRFMIAGHQSTIGRTRTLPLAGTALDRVRFVAAGCQYYEEGHFTAWRRIAEEPIDFVFHYGDYIYEGPDWRIQNPGKPVPKTRFRFHNGPEIYSIDDYRARYALYKSDPDLQAAHAAHPFFMSFDDHEIDNNWASYTDENEMPPEIFALRRAGALQAYYENMPLRLSAFPKNGTMQMYRSARHGDLLNTFVLDTRQYRSNQANFDLRSPQTPEVFAPNRTITGFEQEAWLFDGLKQSPTRWNLIAQQVMMLNLLRRDTPESAPMAGMDVWSGYMNSRRRLLSHIEKHRPGNVLTISGDIHRHFAGDLIQDNGDGKIISSEFVATSITSGGDGELPDAATLDALRSQNPHLKTMCNKRGYLLCDVTRDMWRGDLKIIDKVTQPNLPATIFASYVAEHGEPGLKPV